MLLAETVPPSRINDGPVTVIHHSPSKIVVSPAPAPLNKIVKLSQIGKSNDIIESMVSAMDFVESLPTN